MTDNDKIEKAISDLRTENDLLNRNLAELRAHVSEMNQALLVMHLELRDVNRRLDVVEHAAFSPNLTPLAWQHRVTHGLPGGRQ